MRLLLTAAAVVLASAPAAAQSPEPPPRVLAVGLGNSPDGVTGRFLAGREWSVAGPLAVGLVQRSVLSVRIDTPREETPAFRGGGTALYAETGASLRTSLRLGGGAEVAASAGVAVASATIGVAPYDSGFTAPLEIEATVALGRGLGLTASASRSLPIVSVWSEFERAPEAYALDSEAVTLGLRFGL